MSAASSSSSVFIENTTDLEIITSAYLSPPFSSETGETKQSSVRPLPNQNFGISAVWE